MRTYIRDEDVDRNIGTVLKMLCAGRGVTTIQLARAHGMSEIALRERMSGKRRFTAAEIAAFARYLRVRPGRFFEAAISESESACTTLAQVRRHLQVVPAEKAA